MKLLGDTCILCLKPDARHVLSRRWRSAPSIGPVHEHCYLYPTTAPGARIRSEHLCHAEVTP